MSSKKNFNPPSSRPARRAASSVAPPAKGSSSKEAAAAKSQRAAFPWDSAAVPHEVTETFSGKFMMMHRRELLERASLLRRLGYSRDEVQRRLESYQTWEHEPYHKSRLLAEVEQLVSEVFATKSPRPTSLIPER